MNPPSGRAWQRQFCGSERLPKRALTVHRRPARGTFGLDIDSALGLIPGVSTLLSRAWEVIASHSQEWLVTQALLPVPCVPNKNLETSRAGVVDGLKTALCFQQHRRTIVHFHYFQSHRCLSLSNFITGRITIKLLIHLHLQTGCGAAGGLRSSKAPDRRNGYRCGSEPNAASPALQRRGCSLMSQTKM